MGKWIKGFITGIFSVSFVISLGLVVFYKALIEDMKTKPNRRYTSGYSSYYYRERGEKE